jgi:hypothetical protein
MARRSAERSQLKYVWIASTRPDADNGSPRQPLGKCSRGAMSPSPQATSVPAASSLGVSTRHRVGQITRPHIEASKPRVEHFPGLGGVQGFEGFSGLRRGRKNTMHNSAMRQATHALPGCSSPTTSSSSRSTTPTPPARCASSCARWSPPARRSATCPAWSSSRAARLRLAAADVQFRLDQADVAGLPRAAARPAGHGDLDTGDRRRRCASSRPRRRPSTCATSAPTTSCATPRRSGGS